MNQMQVSTVNSTDQPTPPSPSDDTVIQSKTVAQHLQRLSDLQDHLADLADPRGSSTTSDDGPAEPDRSAPDAGGHAHRWRRRSTT